MIGAIIHTTGVVDVVDKEWNLQEMQQVVGGLVECIGIGVVDMWINEEGKLIEDMRVNPMASGMFQQAFHPTDDVIMGDVLMLGSGDADGNSTSLSGEFLDTVVMFAQVTGGTVDESAQPVRSGGE
jgi:hypothetical protein